MQKTLPLLVLAASLVGLPSAAIAPRTTITLQAGTPGKPIRPDLAVRVALADGATTYEGTCPGKVFLKSAPGAWDEPRLGDGCPGQFVALQHL